MLSATQATQICQECTQAFLFLLFHTFGVPCFPVSRCFFVPSSFRSASVFCCHYVCIAAKVCRLLSSFSPASSCMLRRLVVNGRVNVCIYIIKLKKKNNLFFLNQRTRCNQDSWKSMLMFFFHNLFFCFKLHNLVIFF